MDRPAAAKTNGTAAHVHNNGAAGVAGSRHQQKLVALAADYGVQFVQRKEVLQRGTLPQYANTTHYDEATKLLANARRNAENFKDPSKKLVNRFKSQSKKERLDRAENWDFSADERASLLEKNISENGDVGLSQAFLEYRNDNLYAPSTTATIPTAKLVRSLTRGTQSSDAWLATAVANKNIQHVVLLASRGSSAPSLNRAFNAAISSNAPAGIVEELFRYGVDPNSHSEKISLLIQQSRRDLLEPFLRSQTPLQPVYLNSALFEAVRVNNAEIAAILLAYGADPNYQAAKSFLDTVRSKNLSMVALLLAGPQEHVKIRPEYLDHAVSIVVENDSRDKERHDLISMLLSAGATSKSRFLEDELFRSMSPPNIDIIELLVSSGTTVDHGEARCVRAALEAQDLRTLEILLRGHISTVALSKAVPQAMAFRARDQRLQAMKLLIQKGVSGPEVNQAQVDAIGQEDGKLFDELRASGADVNYMDGFALQTAFGARNPAYLQVLCDRSSIEYGTAARLVPMALHPKYYVESRSAIVLKACSRHTNVLDKALADEVAVHGARDHIISLLLKHGASVDAGNGAALHHAALAGKERAVQQLAEASPSHLALHAAFSAASGLPEVSRRFPIMKVLLNKAGGEKIGQDDALLREAKNAAIIGNDIVSLLLSHKASVDYHDGEALCSAIDTKSSSTVKLLLAAHPGKDALIRAFKQSTALPKDPRLEYITMISEEAMSAPVALPVGLYLEQAIQENDLQFCKLLLHYGADPNREGGKAFIRAAQLSSTSIFEELLLHRPEIKRLLPTLIRELHNEDQVVTCLSLCFERLKIQLKPTENVLLFLALDQFEEGVNLTRFLLSAGCSPGATRELQLKEGSEIEPVTPLIWALSRPLPGPSKAVILALLEAGSATKPEYITSVSNTSALLEAARTGRHTIVSKLLSLGAKPSAQDADGNSALLLASEYGDLASVEAFLQVRVRANDGSLHSAARGAHEPIVKLLLDHGHTPNHIHGGRSALAELCRHGHPEGVDWHDRAYWVVDILIKRGTNMEARYAGKNILHLALDNEMPLPVLKVLLDFPQFSEHLNEEPFLFEDGTGTIYSPLSYAEVFYAGPATEKTKLLKLLEDKNCARNMWNRQGKHPPNYTYNTMPAHLKAMVDQEKLEELKLAKELQRRQEEARIERELADRNHKHLLDQAAARHRVEAIEAQQREAREAAADMRRREAEKRHKLEVAAAEAQSLRDKHQLEVNQQAALAMQRQQIEDRDRARAHRHQQEMNVLEQERISHQSALALEQDRVNEQQHMRHLQLLDRQDASVKMRANEMRSVANAAMAANTNVGLTGPSQPPRQIGFGNDWATVD